MPNGFGIAPVLDFIYRIYARQTPDALVTVLLGNLSTLIAGDNVMVGLHDAEARKINGLALSHPFSHMNFLFQANEGGLIAHHPFWDRILDEDNPLKILSEMRSARAWHDNPVYREVLVADRVLDHINVEFGPSRDFFTTISIIRSRRGFGDRDRRMFLTLRPHLIQAFQNARMVELADRIRGEGPTRMALECAVDRQGKVRFDEPEAESYFRQWFGERSDVRPAFDRWLQEELQRLNRGTRCGEPFRFEAGRASYRAALRRRWCEGDYRLYVVRDDSAAASSPLTARERDILHWMQQGKTNAEIAEILAIGVYTVKQHAKKIFRKLGVENRTAAALHAATR